MDNWAMGMDPELGNFKAGSGIIIPDPQHWLCVLCICGL